MCVFFSSSSLFHSLVLEIDIRLESGMKTEAMTKTLISVKTYCSPVACMSLG